MFRVISSLAAAGSFVVLAATALPAQDTTAMTHDAMGHGKKDTMMMTPAMGHGMKDSVMMHDAMNGMKAMGGYQGMFTGMHDHKMSGGYSIVSTRGQSSLVLGSDFSLDGAPDPYVVLSADDMGGGTHFLNLGKLKARSGTSTYAIPSGTDLSQYSHVLVWCKKYNVTLGEAQLASGDAMMHK